MPSKSSLLALSVVATLFAGQNAAALPLDPAKSAEASTRLSPADIFGLRFAADAQISQDGKDIAYLRVSLDIQTDRRVSELRVMSADGRNDRAVPGGASASQPRWSPDGKKLLFAAPANQIQQLFSWTPGEDRPRQLTSLPTGVSEPVWSPDGSQIAFATQRPKTRPILFVMPPEPAGAVWAPPAKIDVENFKAYDVGEIEPTTREIHVVSSSGQNDRSITPGENDFRDVSWTADGSGLLVAGKKDPADKSFEPVRVLFRLPIDGRPAERIANPVLNSRAPIAFGAKLAFLGTNRSNLGSFMSLFLIDRPGGQPRALAPALDRDVRSIAWAGDGKGVFILYADQSQFRIARIDLSGQLTGVADHVGPSDIGRQQAKSIGFSAARTNAVAFVRAGNVEPGDVALASGGRLNRLTGLDDALIASHNFGQFRELDFKSGYDGLAIQSWLVTPPGYVTGQHCPLILSMHGGPWGTFSGEYFGGENLLYAAAGFCVLSVNYRGSGSYGQAFADTTMTNFPSHDFDDLMSGVDAAIAAGYADPARLYVTGGSAGGELTAWVVGHTHRFKAAVAQKALTDLSSFVLTVDNPQIYRDFAEKLPWDDPAFYKAHSPITFIRDITTPTMVLDGTNDVRTPTVSQSEAFYNALRLRGVPTMLVRLPGAGHEYSSRPSQLIAGALATLGWFARYPAP